jgi:hypothetical protein
MESGGIHRSRKYRVRTGVGAEQDREAVIMTVHWCGTWQTAWYISLKNRQKIHGTDNPWHTGISETYRKV